MATAFQGLKPRILHLRIAYFLLAALITIGFLFVTFPHRLKKHSTVSTQTLSTNDILPPGYVLHYPQTRIDSVIDTLFGVKVADPYRWLEEGDSQEVIDWSIAQNNLCRSYLDALPERKSLKHRYEALFRSETMSLPIRDGKRLFYMKRRVNDEKSIYYWRSIFSSDPTEHVLIDPNQFSKPDNISVGETIPSPQGKFLVYTLRQNGEDEATLYIKNVETGVDLANEVIKGAKYASPSWMPDGSGFVYTYLPPQDQTTPEDRPGLAVVRYHKLGTNPKQDPRLSYPTGDPAKFVNAFISDDGRWIFLEQQIGWNRTELYYQPLSGQPSSALSHSWRTIISGRPYIYSLECWRGQGYILTNDEAPHFQLFTINLNDPRRSKWRELIPESSTRVLQDAILVDNSLVVKELVNVASRIAIYDLNGRYIREIALPGIGAVSHLAGQPQFNDFYYQFENFIQPPEIFKDSVNGLTKTLIWGSKLSIDSNPYIVEQKFFLSKDRTQIPMFIVHRKDIVLDGRTPFLLHGYGGFGLTPSPVFSSGLYPWLEAGGGYALVNLRGGGEFGEKWHEEGMLTKKQNVFDDCISAAEYLISKGYTNPRRLGLRGGSNGGLLVGAVLTQRPDLFRAMVCESPLLDMLRFDRTFSGKTWVPEYGSPEDEEQFKTLYAYSPYHHIDPLLTYPAVLICVANNDDRVDPMHARKMAAALQAAPHLAGPILLRTESQAGHHGAKHTTATVEHAADLWSFLINELGPFPK